LFQGITLNVLAFGLVSFFTDVSSEMIYPLLPLFLTSVLGAGPAFLGIIEGTAESTAAFLKLFSGILSDRVKRRKNLVVAGYGLSSVARPLVAAASSPLAVLFIRFADRAGKGVRTSPRDALLADSSPPEVRGKAFGLHRSMDHAGAIVGPLIATALLAGYSLNLRTVFWLAAIPAAAAMLVLIFLVREAAKSKPAEAKPSPLGAIPTGRLRTYLLILLLFTLGNSSDAFLLLRAQHLGVASAAIPLLWTFFSLVKMLSVMPFGSLSDRLGRRGVIIAGWGVYALAYLGFGLAQTALQAWLLFGFYGLFYGLTEGVEKAFLVDLAQAGRVGGAFGWYNCAVGAGALPASLIFGFLWQSRGAATAFGFGAALAAVASILLLALVRPEGKIRESKK
jgi:MFS family permease